MIDPLERVRFPTVDPEASVATPAPRFPVVERFSFSKEIEPPESVIEPSARVKSLLKTPKHSQKPFEKLPFSPASVVTNFK